MMAVVETAYEDAVRKELDELRSETPKQKIELKKMQVYTG